MIRLLAFVLLAAALTTYAFWVYLRVELPVRGRRILAVARASAFVLLLAILFDPRLPGSAVGAGGRWALLDVSASMRAGEDAPWAAARARARALEEDGWTIVPFGGPPGGDVPDEPAAVASVLAPALERALEAGVSEVKVLSDGRIDDPVRVRAALASALVPVAFELVPSAVVNAGVARFDVRGGARAGEGPTAEVEVFAEGSDAPVAVEVREEGRLVATTEALPPQPGLVRSVSLALPPPADEGRIRYTARVTRAGDAFPDDDEAVRYHTAGHDEGALVLVSLLPDWEPRHLLPVLEGVTGLPAAGYLRVGEDRFAPMGRAAERGGTVDSARVGRAATDAAVLVVHGLSERTDAWGSALAERAARRVVWPVDAASARRAGVEVSGVRTGEWYVTEDVPASPVAPELAGVRVLGLPPLTGVLEARRAPGAPLLVQLGGTGPALPALALVEVEGARSAVPLATGLWRWAARPGAPREAYRRLWSAVAGWLLAPSATTLAADVRPARWVFEPDQDTRWHVPPGVGPVRLRVEADGATVRDTVLDDGAESGGGVLPPGSYAYRAEDSEGRTLGEGRFDVARASLELARIPVEVGGTGEVGRGADGVAVPGAGRPLRASPWPYLLVLLLLCGEWVARRRAGLR